MSDWVEKQKAGRYERELFKICALRFDGDEYIRAKWIGDHHKKIIDSVEKGEPFDSLNDNFAAFYQLRNYLTSGSGNALPQISQQWILLRKLFLVVCIKKPPKKYQCEGYMEHWESWFEPSLAGAKELVKQRLKEAQSATLGNIRNLIATESELPSLIEGSAFEDIYEKFRDLEHMRCDYDMPSIQKILIGHYQSSGFPEITEEFEKAKQSARRQLFDIAADLVLGTRSGQQDFGPEEAVIRTKILANPYVAQNQEQCVDYIFDGMGDQGWKFLYDLAGEMKKADERKHRVKADLHMLVLAKHWIDPHCPLWLMSKSAMMTAGRTLSTRGEWSDSRVEGRLDKKTLCQSSKQAIRHVATVKSKEEGCGDKLTGFEILKSIRLETLPEIDLGYEIKHR